jgi:alkanesulfonate monooxygenase SsuD/methylene tetrahydromethanopterin reductase-like flavin-dependent oxidoreductase (luciferase family)
MRIDSGLHAHAGSIEGYPNVAEWVDQATFCEQAGFDGMWSAEHHFFWDGWTTPTPTNGLLVESHIAALTSRIRLGQCGNAINDWHPIRLAEDAAMLDHMSGGRLDFGIMRGLNNRVAGNFHPDADRRDVPKANARLWESLEVVRKAWTGKPFRHDGPFFQFPYPGWMEDADESLDPEYYSSGGEMIALAVQPAPCQQPGPPVWLMADSPGSHVEAAGRGVNVMAWGRSTRAARESWDAYYDAYSALTPEQQASGGGKVALMRFVYVAETMAEAERVARPALNELFGHMGPRKNAAWGRTGMIASDETLTDDDLNADWFDYLRKIEWAIVGTSAHVTEKLLKLQADIGLDHLVQYWSVAALSPQQLRRSQELFAEHVRPNFR